MCTFEQVVEKIVNNILEMRNERGDPGEISLSIYESEQSLRRAGIAELSLEEHTERVYSIACRLREEGLTVNIYTVPTES